MESVTGTELLAHGAAKPRLLNPVKQKAGSHAGDARRDESQTGKISFTLVLPQRCPNY